MKLVSFSGAQSTGKTTLLNHLLKLNSDHPDITFVPEVTRRLKREYGVPINEEATIMTQYLVMTDHYLNVHHINDRKDFKLKILDRCSLDGEVYVRYFANKFFYEKDEYGRAPTGDFQTEWESFARRAAMMSYDLMMPHYDLIFLPDHRDVPLVDDGERSASKHFRDSIIKGFEERIEDYKECGKKMPKFVTLSGTVEQRLATIQKELKDLCPEVDVKI